MIGRDLLLPERPNKIICLVPSLTETLYYLGLEDRVVGISKFCKYPEDWFSKKSKIGGTKNIDLEKVEQLGPDLIIGNKEENNKEDIDKLSEKYPVWVSDINSFDDALHAIEWIGELTQSEKKAQRLIFEIQKAWSNILSFPIVQRSCAYIIWNKPLMSVGNSTFINDILLKLNFINVYNSQRYPETNFKELKDLNPEFIFLSSEPFPFSEKHKTLFKKEIPDSQIILVDGEMFSWYGSRMKPAATYFSTLLNDLHNK